MPVDFDSFTKEAVLTFNSEKYDLRAVACSILDWKDLSTLHESVAGSTAPNQITFANDQSTAFHKQFYNSPQLPTFLEVYERLVKEVIAPLFDEKVVIFQKKPTFRVHLPNNLCVGQKHRDGDYFHPAGEINFWLPFTKVFDTNGIFVESEPEKGDFHNVALDYGEVFRFYGNKCWHYNEVNTTGCTRVSIDFRIIPGSRWDFNAEPTGSSVKSGMKFVIGGYYDTVELQTPLHC